MDCVRYGSAFSGGTVTVPPSKSAAIRALLCGGLACLNHGSCRITNLYPSEDIMAAAGALPAMGVQVKFSEDKTSADLTLLSPGTPGGQVDCGESGSLLRFIVPVAAALGGSWRFLGEGRLPQRPLGVYQDLLPVHGAILTEEESNGCLPLRVEGKLIPGRFELPGNISSQFVTGLLLALPLLDGDSQIVLTSPLESRGYVNMTLDILNEFGIHVLPDETGWTVPGRQQYACQEIQVEGDWSQAAFFLNLAALSPTGAAVRLQGLKRDSLQGDRACVEVFGRFGLNTFWEGNELIVQNLRAKEPYGGLCGQRLDVSDITDMVPAAAVCAAFCQGETRFENAARLRLKESDRLSAMKNAVNALGGQAREESDTLIIQGAKRLPGGRALGMNDHRVVMALSGAGLRCEGSVEVTDPWSIRKTYPTFYEELKRLGGEADVVQLG